MASKAKAQQDNEGIDGLADNTSIRIQSLEAASTSWLHGMTGQPMQSSLLLRTPKSDDVWPAPDHHDFDHPAVSS